MSVKRVKSKFEKGVANSLGVFVAHLCPMLIYHNSPSSGDVMYSIVVNALVFKRNIDIWSFMSFLTFYEFEFFLLSSTLLKSPVQTKLQIALRDR